MLSDDKVAIYRTKGGASLLQMYTSNKEALNRTLSKVNLLRSGGCGSTFDPLRDKSTIKVTGSGAKDRSRVRPISSFGLTTKVTNATIR